MATVIGVRFREVGRVYHFDPGEHEVQKGERVIVETARGVECGEVIQGNTELPDEQIVRPLKMMIRIATAEDLQAVEGKSKKEADAFKICEEKILKHGLDMKLVNVEYTFDASKIVFHFTADQRVDFRALVRDLAGVFRTRIEMRQIGVRDEAKMLGGLGICGRPFCCSLYMGDFHPVSIKMAKEQNLSLNPAKISGTCGRLMCCLKYEEVAYEDALKNMPRVGNFVETPEGRGFVVEINAVSGMVKVKLDRRPETVAQSFHISKLEGFRRKAAPPEEGGEAPAEAVLAPDAEEPAEEAAPIETAVPPPEDEDAPITPIKAAPAQQKGNWRERHVNKKREAPQSPALQRNEQQQRPERQQQPQPARPKPPPPQQQRPPQPAPQPRAPLPQEARNVPRYGEVPRRATAPQPNQANNQQNNRRPQRQPWQKRQEQGDEEES
jgi:cell fate regulator YaaT (PSP1 superfamily)